MKFKRAMGLGALALAACIAFPSFPALAAGDDKIEVVFTDITESDPTTLSGEAKIKVSVKGAQGDAAIAQMALGFSGDLKYKSIRFLKGENNPPECFLYSPNTALSNSTKQLMPSIIANKVIKFDEETDLFVLTFAGEEGKSVKLDISDLDNTYCTVGGKDLKATENESITVNASGKTNTGKNAVLKLVMDKVDDFTAGSTEDGYLGSGIEVRITSDTTDGYTVYTVLNNTLVSKGGHRESESVPTFTVENTVLADDTYTVEVSGIGYVPYKKTGVTFDAPLSLTNADFIPGDVNADNKVDIEDKKECEKAMADPSYAADLEGAADFNRDGKVDKYDLEVFDGIEEPSAVPSKLEKPTAVGGTGKITLTWKKPANETVTGYVIKYSIDPANLALTQEITNPDTTSVDITGLSSGVPYYFAIAAKNEEGIGEYSDTVSATANANNTNTGAGGGGGGGGSTGGGGGSAGGGNTNTPTSNEPFTDLGSHEWAKASIYTLKNKGIISGVSDTEFAPANNIKRGDFILILTRMLGVKDEFAENFSDVPESAYYYNAVGSAKAAGIANGSDGMFMPENNITRQDLITLAYRAFLGKGYISESEDLTSLDEFADKDAIADYALAPMASMVNAGIIKGADGGVNPTGSATRAEVAVMCARLLDLMK